MIDTETVIRALDQAIDIAFGANCELAKVPVGIAIHAVSMLKEQEPKKQENTGKNCWPMCGDIAEGG